MNKRVHVKIAKADAFLTAPVLDVFFLLLLFFVLSTSFVFQAGYLINLPDKGGAPFLAADKLIITISNKSDKKDYQIFFNDSKVDWRELELKLAEEIKNRQNPTINRDGEIVSVLPTILVKADKNIPYGFIMRIQNLAYSLKANVVLAVSAKEGVGN